jgi:hypothetical protein
MLYNSLIQQQLQGLNNFGNSSGMSQAGPTNSGSSGQLPGFDLLGLQQMQMGGLP